MSTLPKYQSQIRPEFSRIHLDKDIPYIVPIRFPYILGLVGKKFSGKSEIIKHLVSEYHFTSFSLAFYVKREAECRRLYIDPTDRRASVLKNLGDLLRKDEHKNYDLEPEFFGGYLARKFVREFRRDIVEKRIEGRKIVVEGFKNPGEIQVFCKFADKRFFLLAMNTPDEIRKQRAPQEGNLSAPKDLNEFINEYDQPDNMNLEDSPWSRNVERCLNSAKEYSRCYIVDNKDDKESLYKQVDEILKKIDILMA